LPTASENDQKDPAVHPSAWIKDRIATLARNHPIVWVEAPYRLLDPSDAAALSGDLNLAGQSVAVVADAYRLRASAPTGEYACFRP
jgi:hypothetical protein